MAALTLGAAFTIGDCMAPYIALSRFLDLLGPERRPVAELWRALRVERRELAAWLEEHRDALAAEGVQLHVATRSQTGRKELHITIGEQHYSALSRPQAEQPAPRPRKARPAPAEAPQAAQGAPAPLAVVEPAPLATLGDLAAAGRAADAAAARGVFAAYRGDLAAATLRAHNADLARWGAYLAAVGVEGAGCAWAEQPDCWRGVSWGLVEGFTRWQEAEGYTLASIARALSTVRGYAKQAARAGALDAEALRLIETVKAPRGRAARNRDAGRETTRKGPKKAEATPITRGQARALKKQPDTPMGRRDALLMALLLDHGLRVSELADLRVTDLDLGAGLLRFYRRKVHKEQTHRLSRDALRAARRYFDAGDAPAAGPLLRGGAEGQPGSRGELGAPGVSTRQLAARVATLGERIGAPGLSPHDCRHAWATWASEAGTPVRDLQEAGGWASPAMPLRYAQAAAIANERVQLGEDDAEDD